MDLENDLKAMVKEMKETRDKVMEMDNRGKTDNTHTHTQGLPNKG